MNNEFKNFRSLHLSTKNRSAYLVQKSIDRYNANTVAITTFIQYMYCQFYPYE